MRRLAASRLVPPLLALLFPAAAGAADPLPGTLDYTFFVRGKRVGGAHVRVAEDARALRFQSTLTVDDGTVTIELSTRTEADPRTYALRRFSFEGTKGGAKVGASVTVDGDSAYGVVSKGETKSPRKQRVTPSPMVVWEDWVMELEVLLALQQAREFAPRTRGLLLASSYATAQVTLGYTGEAVVESAERSLAARKLLVAIAGGEPFESMVDSVGVPVYIHFPGVRAEVFLDDFFGDNPVSRYSEADASASDP
jgi:hypothetical protein